MRRLLMFLAPVVVAACARPPVVPPSSPLAAKCSTRAPEMRPLIVAWDNNDKALLESQRGRGLVAVRYVGCEMKVLSQCGLPAKYEYAPITPKRDHLSIHTADELVARLPVGAANVAGKLESKGNLSVDMIIVGRYEAARKVYRKEDLEGDCNEATHLVSGFSVGAFEFVAGAEADVSATVGAANVGVDGKHGEKVETVSQDGDAASCKKTGAEDKTPLFGCGGTLQLELIELRASATRCGPGLEWDGQGCVQKTAGASPAVECPDGTKWNGDKCIAKVSTGCSAGMHFEPGKGCVPGAPAGDGLVDDK